MQLTVQGVWLLGSSIGNPHMYILPLGLWKTTVAIIYRLQPPAHLQVLECWAAALQKSNSSVDSEDLAALAAGQR